MSKKIFMMRTAPYDYLIDGKNLYQSFNAVAKVEQEVELSKSEIKNFEATLKKKIMPDLVLCSPRLRSVQTAKLFTPQPVVAEELAEIKYSMEDFVSEAEFYNQDGMPNVDLARKKFVQALITDKLSESYISVIKRIEKVLTLASKSEANELLIISHGFFMKVLQAYTQDSSIKYRPQNLLSYFSGEKETFKFGETTELFL